VSPVKLGDSPGGSASVNTGATSSVATPSDALGAAGGVGAFMATPGYGVTRGLGGLAADTTPVSRYAPVNGTDAGRAWEWEGAKLWLEWCWLGWQNHLSSMVQVAS
jgi:hypothetical protein